MCTCLYYVAAKLAFLLAMILSFLLHLVQYAFQIDDYLFYVFEFAAGGMLFHHLVSTAHVTVI